MPIFKDRVQDTTATTGTGNITLDGTPPTGYRGFTVMATGASNPFDYVIDGGAEWEVGRGYLSNATTLVRSTVLSSSNSGSLVDFSAGTKYVYVELSADMQERLHTRSLVFSIALR